MKKPLADVKVLDLSRVLAGPFCTMILADLGAEIIKIEVPGSGDDSRGYGPFLKGKSIYFLSVNRGKQSLSLNLKTEEGKDILRKLVQKADVLVENFRPGTMEKLGLGYETLQSLNPRLIYAAISGFGHTGPDSKTPVYDIIAQAMGGVMSITGWPDSPPTRVGMSLGDITASLYGAIGIITALYQRILTGKGQKVDIAMLDCQLAVLENALVRLQTDQQIPGPLGNRHPTITPFQAFMAKDRYLVLGVGNDAIWERFCDAVERDDLKQSQDFSTNRKRTENIAELTEILENIFREKTAAHWLEILDKASVPASLINNIEEAMENRQILARNMIVKINDPAVGPIKVAGNPVKMSSLPEEPFRAPPPEVGEHSEQILRELLNMSQHEIDELKLKKVTQ